MRVWLRSKLWRALPWFCLYLALLSPAHASGGDEFTFSDADERVNLGRKLRVLKDVDGNLSIDAVRRLPPGHWYQSTRGVPNFFLSKADYWLSFRVHNPLSTRRALLLELANPMVDYVDVYIEAAGGALRRLAAGDRRPTGARTLEHRHFLFEFAVPPNASRRVYIKVESHDGLYDPMPFNLWSRRAFHRADFHRTPPMGGVLLVLIIVAVYHAFVFASLRDYTYLYYTCFMIALFALMSLHWGFAQMLFLRDWPDAANRLYALTAAAALFFHALFSRNFLESRRWAPALDRLLRAFQYAMAVHLAAALVLPYRTANVAAIPAVFVGAFLFCFAGAVTMRAGHKPARYYLLAFLMVFVGICARAFYMMGFTDAEAATTVLNIIGLLLMVTLLALGLADRINSLRAEKEALTRDANARLERQNKQLRALDQLKDDFLANTSHELRTPLNGIIGITESVLEGANGPLSQPARENLGLVAASGRRLSRLVDDVLDFSRLRHGDISLLTRATDLAAVVDVVAALSRPLLGPRPVKIVVDLDRDLPPVLADEDRLQQIMHNLMGNAIKFTREGEIRISARRLPAAARGGEELVEVAVADTGIGIPSSKHEAIFESFTQADGSIARQYGGTGLGLAITRKLVELHGGTIRVDPLVARGTRLVFTLPIAHEAPREVDAPGTAAAVRVAERLRVGPSDEKYSAETVTDAATTAVTMTEGETSRFVFGSAEESEIPKKPVRALIVDDDPVNLAVVRNILSLDGIQTEEAAGGRQALDLIEAGTTFDLVLLDVMMPGLTGYEVCRILRENFSESELPVIMLTAKNRVNDMETAFGYGANDYLSKPFDTRELRARVRTMIALREAAQTQSHLAALEGELEVARRIQQSLIPEQAPVIQGARTAARYRAMQRVGGDFYDFRIQDGKFGMLMADVSGHGVPAALIVSMVHLAFWFQKEVWTEPDRLFHEMNAILCENTGGEFVTACYALIDFEAGTLESSNAGHLPVLIWRAGDQRLIEVRPPGRIFGFFEDAEFERARVPLEAGDRILIYTDGVVEAPSLDGDAFGFERFCEYIRDCDALEPEAFVAQLVDLIEEWSGGAEYIEDDIAVVVVDYKREPASG